MLKQWHKFVTQLWLNWHAKHGKIKWTTGYLGFDKRRHFTCLTCGAERGQR